MNIYKVLLIRFNKIFNIIKNWFYFRSLDHYLEVCYKINKEIPNAALLDDTF